jgi:serine/threonine-protein kinase RsbW
MYESHREGENINAVFSAAFGNIDALCGEMGRMIEAAGLPDRLFPLQLIIREAVNNAIVHGSGSDPERTIEVAFQLDKEGVSICVRDHGAGFDWRSEWEKIADPLVPSGRGMELMRTYATEIVFNEKGNQVTLKVAW